jgi:hypothetical protein
LQSSKGAIAIRGGRDIFVLDDGNEKARVIFFDAKNAGVVP